MCGDPPAFRVSSTRPLEEDAQVHWTIALLGSDATSLQKRAQNSDQNPELQLGELDQLTPAARRLTVVSPLSSRDTGLAIYVALAMIKHWAPNATVTIMPSHVDVSTRYLHYVQVARNVATRIRDLVVLLGGRPNKLDVGATALVPEVGGNLEAPRGVGFFETRSIARAEAIIRAGAAWNTMMACGSVDALWSLARNAEPHLIGILDSLVPLIGSADEPDAISHIYRTYLPVSFAMDILIRTSKPLAVIELDLERSGSAPADEILALQREGELRRLALGAELN
jgi:mannose-1-phosphate guanylyltransferase